MGFFSHIFSKKNTSILGVDIGSSSLKVVQLRKEHGIIILETYGELALGPYANVAVGQATNLPADTIAKTLTDLLRESNVTTVDSAVSIPSARSLLVFVELPYRKSADEHFHEMVTMQLWVGRKKVACAEKHTQQAHLSAYRAPMNDPCLMQTVCQVQIV